VSSTEYTFSQSIGMLQTQEGLSLLRGMREMRIDKEKSHVQTQQQNMVVSHVLISTQESMRLQKFVC